FGTTSKGIEDWKMIISLRRHEMDVLDIAWSPDDSMLASCSADKNIFIWQIENATDPATNSKVYSKLLDLPPIKVLQGQEWIESVSWDPIGMYFASATMNSIKVWKRSDWKEEATIP